MKNTFTALCLLLSLNAFCQTTYFVNANASGGNNGTSWTDAFTKLQDALSTAESGDQVWVAAGIYYPDEGAGLTDNDRTQSFRLKTGVAIYGGFAGTETALTERKITANITTLSGDIDQDDAPENNAYHVVQSSSVNNTAVLDCFTITGGNANDAPAPNFYGGGMYNNASSPTLIGCSFIENTAVYDGGGIFNVNSSPILTRCSFAQNTARLGGGIFNVKSAPRLTGCRFASNRARSGGGMYNNNSGVSLTLTNCSFSENMAEFSGGGIFNNFSSPTLTNCSFTGNTAQKGGGIDNFNSSPTLTNCSFSENMASIGGAIYNLSSIFLSSSPTLTNCILWGDSGEIGDGGRINSPVVSYSIVQGGYTGTGNLDQDPLFVDAEFGDLHLQSGSPAINAGLNSANTTLLDLDGNPRVVDGTIDMGAFEFHHQATAVSSFTLINADNDEDIRELKDGDTLNLAILPSVNLNIRANTNPAITGSVTFDLSGQQTRNHIENNAPYALFANNKGDYYAWTPSTGDYTLTAAPYSAPKGQGEKGTPLTIHFYVTYFAQTSEFVSVPGTSNPWLAGMPDGTAASDGDVAPDQSPVSVPIALPSYSYIEVSNVTGSVGYDGLDASTFSGPEDGFIHSHDAGAEHGKSNITCPVNGLIGVFVNDEIPTGTVPSALDFTDQATGDYLSISPALKQVFFIGDGQTSGGVQQRIVIPKGATRLFLGTLDGYGWYNNGGAFNLTVTATNTPAISSFTLIDADTDEDIRELKSGDVINLAALPTTQLNIRANTNFAIVGSVEFNLSGQLTRNHIENYAPYALFANKKGDYFGWTPSKGEYSLTATPYEGKKGSGKKGGAYTLVFSVVDGLSPVRLASAANAGQKPVSNGAQEGKVNITAMPNPFVSQTTISFSVAKSGYTTLGVYDMKGVEVARLYQASAEGGKVYRANFESKHLPSGVYIVRLATGKQVETYKLVLMR